MTEDASRTRILLIAAGGVLFASLGLVSLPLIPAGQAWRSAPLLLAGGIGLGLGAYALGRGALPGAIEMLLRQVSDWLGVTPGRAMLLAAAPALSWAAWLMAGERERMPVPTLAVGLWLASIAALWAGAWSRNSQACRLPGWPGGELAVVGLLTIAGLAARILQLDSIPWLFTGDEGAASLTALEFVTGSRNNLFNIAWFSFPALATYLQSIPIAAFGRSIASARLASTLAGCLAVAAVWWCARPLFGRLTALAAAAVMATFPLHIHFSRTALNNVWDSLSAALFLGALYRGWTTNRRSAFLLAGCVLGLSQYFYTTARAWLLLLPAWIVIAWLRDRQKARVRLPGLFLLCLAALVVVLPLAGFYLLHPAEFLAPMNRVSMFGEWGRLLIRLSGRTPLQTVWHQVSHALMGFGPWPMMGHFSPAPMLLPLTAVLFWLGVVVLVGRRGLGRHRWLLLLPAATILTAAVSDYPPASQRYLLVSPFVAMMIALPAGQAADWLRARWPLRRAWIAVGLASLVAVVAALQLRFYFGEYSPSRQFGDPNTEIATQVARYLQQQGGARDVYFFGPPRMGYYSHGTIEYLVPEATGHDVTEPLAGPPTWSLTRPATFIFLPERLSERVLVQRAYPGGVTSTARARSGAPLFYAYTFTPP